MTMVNQVYKSSTLSHIHVYACNKVQRYSSHWFCTCIRTIGCVGDDSVLRTTRAAAMFLLKTSEVYKLPLSSTNSIMMDVQELIHTVLDNVGSQVTTTLDPSIAIPLCNTILKDKSVVDVFAGLDTTYKQTAYYKEHLGLLVS